MTQNINFQIRLTPDEQMTLTARAVLLTAANEKPYSLQDVVREWIEGGCPIDSSKPGHQPKLKKRTKREKRNNKPHA